ncbi:poly(A)-specific ribonuclease [Pyricularia oryzae]
MDADWGEIAQYHTQLGYRPDPTNPSAHHSAPTAVAFDTRSELLWVGKDQGRVAAYVYFLNNGIMEFQRHIAFLSHPRQQGPVHQFLFNETGVISLGSHNVHMAQRGGMCLANIGHVNMTNLRCMTFTSRGTSEILVAGDQDTMFVIDLNKKQITKEVPAPNHYFLMKKSKYICAASRNGCVDILDPITLKVINTWNTRSAQLNDMDVQHDFIVTCGASLKQGTYMADPYVNVFDLKNMRSFPPISFPPLVTYARMHPKMVTTSIVVSKTGQMHVVDIANPHNPIVRQVLGHTHLALFDVSPSGQAMVFTDTEGYIHVWGPTSKAVSFVDQGLPVEFETEQPNFASIPWSEDFPVNMVGLPHYSDALLSAWPADLSSDVGAPPAQFDQAYVDAMMPNGNVGLYGKAVAGTRRNQVVDTRSADKPQSSLQAPKFLSEKARDGFKGLTMDTSDIETSEDIVPSPIRTDIESLKSVVPNMYHLFEIKFSKFGVDDFDFGYYNKTHHSGLENHITNSYANSLLQLLRFTPILRNLALQHAATSCLDQHCLLCELGYLCDSMEKARGASCQATNMLKMLSQHPAAANLHLLDGDRIASSSAMKIQGLLRFLLDFMSRDYGKTSPGINDLENATATSSQSLIRCDQCKSETSRPQTNYVQDLAYSPVTSNGNKGVDVADSYLAAQQGVARGRMAPAKLPSFSQILKKSIEREQVTRGWCTTCRGYQPLSMRKIIKSIPQVLAANTCISSVEEKKLWATPGWLPEEVGFIIDREHIFCYEGAELDWLIKNGKYKLYVYSLMGLVVNIEPGPTFKPHPVAIINAAHSEPQKPAKSQWHLFNDFHVKPISAREALTFNTSWKTPLVVMFQLKAANNHIDSTWLQRLDTSILYQDQSPEAEDKSYTLLDRNKEAPTPGTVIAIDAEFVLAKDFEYAVNSDGEKETIRPRIHSLGRVSVVRASGDRRGVPFIDDYINIKEPIVNYFTEFSGLTETDLDPKTSRHNLVPLKLAFKKLWLLLNLGCIFVGHGLRSDFRVINLQVPREQVHDTQELFWVEAQRRKLSLAFLAKSVLNLEIQGHMHDSIEDANTAQLLYWKYKELLESGRLHEELKKIYAFGVKHGFRPVKVAGQSAQRTETPPMVDDAQPGALLPYQPPELLQGS